MTPLNERHCQEESSSCHDDRLRFEAAVFEVMGRALSTQDRVDVIAGQYLTSAGWPSKDDYAYADMVICAADCLRILLDGIDDIQSASATLNGALAHWRINGMGDPGGWPRGVTRIQGCIGAIRQAIAAASTARRAAG